MRYWWYVENGEKMGPVEEGLILDFATSDTLNSHFYVWKKGYAEWVKIEEVNELTEKLKERKKIKAQEYIQETKSNVRGVGASNYAGVANYFYNVTANTDTSNTVTARCNKAVVVTKDEFLLQFVVFITFCLSVYLLVDKYNELIFPAFISLGIGAFSIYWIEEIKIDSNIKKILLPDSENSKILLFFTMFIPLFLNADRVSKVGEYTFSECAIGLITDSLGFALIYFMIRILYFLFARYANWIFRI